MFRGFTNSENVIFYIEGIIKIKNNSRDRREEKKKKKKRSEIDSVSTTRVRNRRD